MKQEKIMQSISQTDQLDIAYQLVRILFVGENGDVDVHIEHDSDTLMNVCNMVIEKLPSDITDELSQQVPTQNTE